MVSTTVIFTRDAREKKARKKRKFFLSSVTGRICETSFFVMERGRNIEADFLAEYGPHEMEIDDGVMIFDNEQGEVDEARNLQRSTWMAISDAEEAADDAPVTREEAAARDPIGDESSPKKKSKKRNQRSEYFTYTAHLSHNEIEAMALCERFKITLKELKEKKLIGFHTAGLELGDKTHGFHIQGYMETYSHKVRWTFETFMEMLGANLPQNYTDLNGIFRKSAIWVQQSRGSAEQNKIYTQKDADKGRWFVVDADVPYRNYGRGNQLGRVKEVLDSGATLIAAAQTTGCFDSIMRFRTSLLWYSEMTAPKRNHKTEILWIHGPSGGGKSTFARKHFEKAYWLDPPKNGAIWWDGYDRHQVVVIDDIGPCTLGAGHAGFEYAKRLFDSTPLQVAVHGGKVQFVATKIVITANFPPQEWMLQQYCGYAWDATNPLFRRFTDFATVILFGTEDEDYDRPTKLGANGQAAHYVDGGLGEYLRLQMVAPLEPQKAAPKAKKGYRAPRK